MDLFSFLGRLIGLTVWFIRNITPFVVKVIRATLEVAGVALIGLLKGIVPNAELMANHWEKEFFTKTQVPTRYSSLVWHIFFGAAILTHVLGWIVLSYLTVWLVRVIF